MRSILLGAAFAKEKLGGFPMAECPQGWHESARQSVRSTKTITVATYPGHAVTYQVGTEDASSVSVSCAQGFAEFTGDGYLKWGPVTNSYNSFTCNVECKNSIHSCPVVICEYYTGALAMPVQQLALPEDSVAVYKIQGDECGQTNLDSKYLKYATKFTPLKEGTCAAQGYTEADGTQSINVPVIGKITIDKFKKPAGLLDFSQPNSVCSVCEEAVKGLIATGGGAACGAACAAIGCEPCVPYCAGICGSIAGGEVSPEKICAAVDLCSSIEEDLSKLFAPEVSCSGSADPPAVGSGRCYEGQAGALGVKEDVKVDISAFASDKGTMSLTGSGIEGITCKDKGFTKSGQDIQADLSDCLPGAVTVESVQYCSDDDTIAVKVKDKSIPIPVSAKLKNTACPTEASEVVV